jgi:hypothetical protein
VLAAPELVELVDSGPVVRMFAALLALASSRVVAACIPEVAIGETEAMHDQ